MERRRSVDGGTHESDGDGDGDGGENEAGTTECRWGECRETLPSPDLLGRHLNEVHVGKKQSVYVCEWRECVRGREPLPNRFAVVAHLRRHTGERPYKCEHCAKSFSRSDALNKHSKAQHGIAADESAGRQSRWHASDGTGRGAASDGAPSTHAQLLRRHLEQVEGERAAMQQELVLMRLKIKRIRAEKILLLDDLLALASSAGQ